MLRSAIRASLGVAALGFLGVVAGIVVLAVLYPAGSPAPTVPPPLLSVAAGAFVVGSVTAFVLGAILRFRQQVLHARPRPRVDAVAPASAPWGLHTVDDASIVAEFRPMAIGISQGFVPTNSSIPWAQRFRIYPHGLDMRNLFGHTWVERQRIVGLYRLPGGFRVIWDHNGTKCSAAVSAWFGMKRINEAMEKAGYRFDTD